MKVISIIFWIMLGFFFLGIPIPYQEVILGVCAIAIGTVQLIDLLKI